MGIVNRKLQIAHEKVTVDFAACGLRVPKSERRGLVTSDDAALVFRQAATMLKDDAGLRASLLKLATDQALADDPAEINYEARAAKFLVRAAVQATFKETKDARKKDRVMYAAWQPAVEYDAPDTVTVTVEQLDWLRDLLGKLLDSEDGKGPSLPIEMSQWLVAMIDALHDLYERTLAAIESRAAATAPAE
jgi:hypothetical protein